MQHYLNNSDDIKAIAQDTKRFIFRSCIELTQREREGESLAQDGLMYTNFSLEKGSSSYIATLTTKVNTKSNINFNETTSLSLIKQE